MNDTELDTKERILAAAEAEFLVRGYDGSRMQAIADQAQVNKAMLHYHFGSKDELFAQVFREKSKLLFPQLEATLRQEEGFIQFVCRFVELYVSHLIENPFLPSYLFQVSTNHPELLSQVKLDLPQKFVAAFTMAAKAKTIRPHDPQQFVVSVLGMCVIPFVARNLIQQVLGLDDASYQSFMHSRADEIKRYVTLLLTPET